jgi:hypothetical protein
MRKAIFLLLTFAAAGAFAMGFGAGAFGGIALPMGDMASDENGNMTMSPKFGGKLILEPLPVVDVEVGFAYHLGHGQKDWESEEGMDEPKMTVIPITVGANYKLAFGNAGCYFGGGAGYYMEKIKFSGVMMDVNYTAELTVNKPGVYVGGGFTYAFGKLCLDVNPRYNYVMNKGDYDVTITAEGIEATETMEKDWNDTFVDVLFGVDYFFM